MTDQVSGSSLPQTRDLGRQQQQQQQQPEHEHQEQPSRHTHLHYRNVKSSHQHNHNHQHLHARSQRNRIPDRRDTSDDDLQNTSDIVVIVETISVLQVTDLTVTNSQSESTGAGTTDYPSSTDLPDTTSTSSASDDGNGAGDLSSSSSTSVIEESTVTPSGSSMPTTFPTLSYAPITSTPLSPTPVFPSISGLSNSTLLSSYASSVSSNSTASFRSFTHASDGNFTIFGGETSIRSKASHSSSSSFASSSSVFTHSILETSTSESSSSVTHSTSTAKPNVTPVNGDNGAGSTTDTAEGGDPVSTSASGSDSGNASAATIAGSVVGAISGLAIILILAAVLLRWKKRQSSTKLIQRSGNDRGYGATATIGSGGPSGDGNMSQRRRSIPFAIPAALANLSGHNRFSKSTVSSDGGERGFAKISGRKLPPVIQFGGDGYTDPRATMMSDQSIDYRASQNFFGEAPLSRLAVGAPMLQETSIPVFHASPARTAVETRGAFSDPFSDDHVIDSPTQAPDLVGPSHLPHARSTRSHASFSRFTEDI
ncbi:hypothetical protein GQX73_g4216 [Xylaria multiplex]|uniref:Mid2 domain-containing protein n=1 Tax=Xylaria multiplex TaxID=323545 RepID=A0A7C8IST9_9PEZI|nr:hypothetical protein GQX73_g4216 [Xylaria multiplex]